MISASTSFIHRDLPRRLLQAREAVMAQTRPSLRQHALSDQQWRVLRVLCELGTVDTGRVAREAFILGPSLTGVLTRMERDGLIMRDRAAQRGPPGDATIRTFRSGGEGLDNGRLPGRQPSLTTKRNQEPPARHAPSRHPLHRQSRIRDRHDGAVPKPGRHHALGAR